VHVVHVSYFVDPSGRSPEQLLAAWPTLSHVPMALRRAGVSVTVVQAASTDSILHREEISYHFVSSPSRWVLHPVFRLGIDRIAERVKELSPDVVQFHGLCFPHELRSMQDRIGDIPILVQDHGNRPPRFWMRKVLRSAISGVHAVLFTTADQAHPFFESQCFEKNTRVFEINESSSTFEPGDQRIARRATGIDGDPCIVWIGRLNRTKDPITILEGVKLALSELPSLALWCFYTDAPLLARVQSILAADDLLAKHVHLVGAVPHSDVERVLQAADFFILGSHHEAMGYSVMEALACGTTPIITSIAPFRKLTANGRVGAIWPPGDAAALASALMGLATRDRSTLRRAAREHFESSLSFDVLGVQLRKVYEEVAVIP